MKRYFKFLLITSLTCLAAVCINNTSVFAGCADNNYYGYGSIPSAVWACRDMYNAGNCTSCGALWLGNANDSKKAYIEVEHEQSKTVVALWGMIVWNGAYASQISFGDDNGALSGAANFWRGDWGSPTSSPVTLDVSKFINGLTPTSTETGNRYSRTIQVYRCYGQRSDWEWGPCDGNKIDVTLLVKQVNNFKTDVSTTINNDIVFAGEATSVSANINVSAKTDNYQYSQTPKDSKIQVVEFTLPATATKDIDLRGNSASDLTPFEHFRKIAADVSVAQEEVVGALDAKSPYYYNASRIVPDVAPGTKYCVAIGINPSDSGDGTNSGINYKWNISNASCRTIAIKPTVQIYGSIFSNQNLSGAISNKQSGMLGSWAKYLTVAGGQIQDFYSNGLVNNNTLTIANQDFKHGNINGQSNIVLKTNYNNLKKRICNGPTKYTNVVCYDGNYRISTNLDSSPPQIIVADNIYIDPAVNTVNAWLIAVGPSNNGGEINTCFDTGRNQPTAIGDANFSSQSCSKPLTIHGAISANTVHLNRTNYAPAESIIMNNEIYAWSWLANNNEDNQVTEDYSHELSPKI